MAPPNGNRKYVQVSVGSQSNYSFKRNSQLRELDESRYGTLVERNLHSREVRLAKKMCLVTKFDEKNMRKTGNHMKFLQNYTGNILKNKYELQMHKFSQKTGAKKVRIRRKLAYRRCK